MAVMTVLSGNSAVASAVKQSKPDVVVSCPTMPSSSILEDIASFVAGGELDTEFLNAESESGAISNCIGASAAGGRVFTVTASRGLSLMQEFLFVASSLRLPIVIGVNNRALSAPLNIYADHSDTMAQRDCGWIQIYSENSQEAYDNIIQAFKIAEHEDVRTPVMVGLDGLVTSHSLENMQIEANEEVGDFVDRFNPAYSLIDTDHPGTVGSMAMPDYYFEHKINQMQGIENSRKVIKDVGKEFGDRFGRYYSFFESYKLEDAEYALVLMGSAAGTAKEVVDRLRSKGERFGILKMRVFRPFPHYELRESLSRLKAIAVLDRVFAPGTFGGPLFVEIRSVLYDLEERPIICPYTYGLGGRDIGMRHLEDVFSDLKANCREGNREPEEKYVNLRE